LRIIGLKKRKGKRGIKADRGCGRGKMRWRTEE
jgi:hypothetical protein